MQSTLILRKWKEEKTVAFNFFKNYTDFLVNILKIQIKQKVVFCWVSKAYLYMQNNLLSSMVNSGHQDHFKPIYFFLQKVSTRTKSTKSTKAQKHQTQTSNFYPLKVFAPAKNSDLCCFFRAYIFVLLVFFAFCFCLFLFC